MKIKSKYQIWDRNQLVPAFCRLPANKMVQEKLVKIEYPTASERKKGIKYFIPAANIE